MSNRQCHYLEGNTATISGKFDIEDNFPVGLVTLTILRPDKTKTTQNITAVNNQIELDIVPDMVGRWHVRISCEEPRPTAIEQSFIVVKSAVLAE